MIIPPDASPNVQRALKDADARLRALEREETGPPIATIPDVQAVKSDLTALVQRNKAEPFMLRTTDVFRASGANHAVGLVPDPGASSGTVKFLREDGTWTEPSPTAGGGWTDDGTVVRLTTATDLVGVGTASPATALDIASVNSPLAAYRGAVRVFGDVNKERFECRSASTVPAPGLLCISSRGTVASPTAIQANDFILTLGAIGMYDTSGTIGSTCGAVSINASETHSSTVQGADFRIALNAAGTIAPRVEVARFKAENITMRATEMVFSTAASTERMRIDNAGSVGINTASPLARLHVTPNLLVAAAAPTIGGTFANFPESGTGIPIQVADIKIAAVLGTTGAAATGRTYNKPLLYVELWDNSDVSTSAPNDQAVWAEGALTPAVIIETRATGTGNSDPAGLAVRARSTAAADTAITAGAFLAETLAETGATRSAFALNIVASWQNFGMGTPTIPNLVCCEADMINGVTDCGTEVPGTVTPFAVAYWAQQAGPKYASTAFYVSNINAAWRFGYTVAASVTEWGVLSYNLQSGGGGIAAINSDTTDSATRYLMLAGCGTYGSLTRTSFQVTQEAADPVYIRTGSALRQVTRAAGVTADVGFRALQVS